MGGDMYTHILALNSLVMVVTSGERPWDPGSRHWEIYFYYIAFYRV